MVSKKEVFNIHQIPGLIEPIEIGTLIDISQKLNISSGDQVIEFGAFIGRSTNAIMQGLAKNPNYKHLDLFITYDLFACNTQKQAERTQMLLKLSKSLNIKLSKHSLGDSYLDFKPIFDYYVKSFSADFEKLNVVQRNQVSTFPVNKPIAMLHIDSEKSYSGMKPIFTRFFPLLRQGSIVIFQDFFLHWSTTSIAMFEYLVGSGYFKVLGTAASSLILKCESSFDNLAYILELEQISENSKYIDHLINRAYKRFTINYSGDRKNDFVYRLLLAQYIHNFVSQNYEKSSSILKDLIYDKKLFSSKSLSNDFFEVQTRGFGLLHGLIF